MTDRPGHRGVDDDFLALPLNRLADAALSAATAAGASYADLRVHAVTTELVQLRDGELESAVVEHDLGLAVRVIVDGTWGFASHTGLSPQIAAESARRAVGVAVTLSALRQGCASSITRGRRVFWDEREGRVVARDEERLGAILLSERAATPKSEEIGAALVEGILSGPGIGGLAWSDAAQEFRHRVNFLARALPEEKLPDLSDRALASTLEQWLLPYLAGVRTLAQLARVDLLVPLKGILSWREQKLVEEGAPTHLQVPSGSRVQLSYPADGAPFLAVKLQEMFGLAETPRVAMGRVPVLIHLLSPARRPIQVTADLRSFWNGAYREVCKELKGRYPRHPWPDDPWEARATRHVKKRM